MLLLYSLVTAMLLMFKLLGHGQRDPWRTVWGPVVSMTTALLLHKINQVAWWHCQLRQLLVKLYGGSFGRHVTVLMYKEGCGSSWEHLVKHRADSLGLGN